MSREHGKYGTYSNGHCRCDECREAARLYRRAQRTRRLASGKLSHGRQAAYDCGCRCAVCTAFHSARGREYYARTGR